MVYNHDNVILGRWSWKEFGGGGMYKCSKMLFLDYSCSCYISSSEHRDTQYLGGNVVYVVSSPLAVLLCELSFVSLLNVANCAA